MTEVLKVRDLNVWLPADIHGAQVHVVRDVSFTVERRARLGIAGESGCGKSTLLLSLMGLLPPGSRLRGSIRLNGEEILISEATLRDKRWTTVAMVFQGAMSALNPTQRIGRQIIEPVVRRRLCPKDEAIRRRAELLELVGLSPSVAKAYPHELSGGMRQRACLAMALICRPAVLLADEPTTALDALVQVQVAEALDNICESLGLSLVLVTHDLGLLSSLCGQACVMYAGRIVEAGSAEIINGTGVHPYTKALRAATPSFGVSITDLTPLAGAPPRLDEPHDGCAFRPRCAEAIDKCAAIRPELRRAASGAAAACHVVRGAPDSLLSTRSMS